MSVSVLVSSGYMPRSGIVGSYGGLITIFFLRKLHTVFHNAVSIYFPTKSALMRVILIGVR